MTVTSAISATADIIADFDPDLARVFRFKPFQRSTALDVFCDELTRAVGDELAAKVRHLGMAAIDEAHGSFRRAAMREAALTTERRSR